KPATGTPSGTSTMLPSARTVRLDNPPPRAYPGSNLGSARPADGRSRPRQAEEVSNKPHGPAEEAGDEIRGLHSPGYRLSEPRPAGAGPQATRGEQRTPRPLPCPPRVHQRPGRAGQQDPDGAAEQGHRPRPAAGAGVLQPRRAPRGEGRPAACAGRL